MVDLGEKDIQSLIFRQRRIRIKRKTRWQRRQERQIDKMRYIAVFHNWFVSGKGYEVIEMDVDSEDEAFEKSSAHAYKCQ